MFGNRWFKCWFRVYCVHYTNVGAFLMKGEVVGNLQIVMWLNKMKIHKDGRANVS